MRIARAFTSGLVKIRLMSHGEALKEAQAR
jgi:hypothetical protein